MVKLSSHLFALHDSGGESLITDSGKTGWTVFAEAIGYNPGDNGSKDFTLNFAITPIVRLSNGWYGTGNIPDSSEYDAFAQRVRNYVSNSRGANIWIIGNEPNLAHERPNGPEGEVITPKRYAECYRKCRAAIRSTGGHENDLVLVAGSAPWNIETKYDTNPGGDWVVYFEDVLKEIGVGNLDGFAIHTYTHGNDKSLVWSDAKMGAPYDHRHYHFKTFEDYMGVIPNNMRHLPVFITEFDGDTGVWGGDTGLIQAAYGEINHWNSNPQHQKILCLALYRWGNYDKWVMSDKGGAISDFKQALNNDYRHNFSYQANAPVEVQSPSKIFKQGSDVYVTAEAGLNLRKSPNGEVLELLPFKTILKVLALVDEWVLVETASRKGFVHSDYITV